MRFFSWLFGKQPERRPFQVTTAFRQHCIDRHKAIGGSGDIAFDVRWNDGQTVVYADDKPIYVFNDREPIRWVEFGNALDASAKALA